MLRGHVLERPAVEAVAHRRHPEDVRRREEREAVLDAHLGQLAPHEDAAHRAPKQWATSCITARKSRSGLRASACTTTKGVLFGLRESGV